MPTSCAVLADLQLVHGLRCFGSITRTRNVSEYTLVLALCLVLFVLTCFMKLEGLVVLSVSVVQLFD